MRIQSVCHPHGGCGVGDMVGIQVRASEGLALTGVGGITLLGNLLERHTDFRSSFTTAFIKRRDGIPWGDVLLTYVAFAGSLAVTGAFTTADALATLLGTGAGFDVLELHRELNLECEM